MRTKTLLLTAAVAVVGITASMAQTVYSVNAVGYVNVTVKPGYNLIANPLNGTNNQIGTIIPITPALLGCTVQGWNNGIQDFNNVVEAGAVTWLDGNGDPDFSVFPPGRGFFFYNIRSTNLTLTFVGDVPQGNLTNVIGANYDFVSSIVPQSASLTTMGFPVVNHLTYQTFHNNSVFDQDYDQPLEDLTVGGWVDSNGDPADPVPNVAQGFLITNPTGQPAKNWGRTFTVN